MSTSKTASNVFKLRNSGVRTHNSISCLISPLKKNNWLKVTYKCHSKMLCDFIIFKVGLLCMDRKSSKVYVLTILLRSIQFFSTAPNSTQWFQSAFTEKNPSKTKFKIRQNFCRARLGGGDFLLLRLGFRDRRRQKERTGGQIVLKGFMLRVVISI